MHLLTYLKNNSVSGDKVVRSVLSSFHVNVTLWTVFIFVFVCCTFDFLIALHWIFLTKYKKITLEKLCYLNFLILFARDSITKEENMRTYWWPCFLQVSRCSLSDRNPWTRSISLVFLAHSLTTSLPCQVLRPRHTASQRRHFSNRRHNIGPIFLSE